MKPTNWQVLLALFLVGAPFVTGQDADARRPAQSKRPTATVAKRVSAPEATMPEVRTEARVVRYGERDVVKLRTKLRYTTLIVLPTSEQILDFTCGDKDFWAVNGHQNLALVKPAKAGSQTNLNLITASGNIYSFVLVEVSELANAEPDLKVFVEPKEESMIIAARGAPKFVSSQAVDDYRQQVQVAKEETRQVKQSADAAIDRGISKFISNVRFPYRFEAGKKPFFLRAMYNDGRFTYIQARPEETPTLYEIKDGQPNLINFEYRDGVYVVSKILDRGYFVIGKQKQAFNRQD